MKRSELRRKTHLRASQPLKTARPPQTRLRTHSGLTMADALRTPFKAKHPVNGRACEVCGDRASQWHHLLGQQHLRTFAAVEAKRRGMSPEEVRSLLRTLLRDERNLTALCWDCHQAVEARTIRLYLPQSAHDFASELGSEWLARVQQAYPPIERRAA